MATLTPEQIEARKAARKANEEALAPFMDEAEKVLIRKWGEEVDGDFGMGVIPAALKANPSVRKQLKDIAKGLRNEALGIEGGRKRSTSASVTANKVEKATRALQFAFGQLVAATSRIEDSSEADEVFDAAVDYASHNPLTRKRSGASTAEE